LSNHASSAPLHRPRSLTHQRHSERAEARSTAGIHAFLLAAFLFLFISLPAFGAERFPPPDFTAGHVLPETTVPGHQARAAGWLDVTVLVAALALASWITLKVRSRVALVVLGLACLAYFGFWRRGCVCAIGSIQNVALGVADPAYPVPLAVVAFFILPLVFALIWGRGFCGGVCPHGALQDLVLVKPVKVPGWLDEVLRFLPWIYLGLAVLLAATGGLFIICKFDPFVGFFRMAGNRAMLILGGGMLVLSLFVGRPYCRYLCPYGALLGFVSRVSKWRPTVAPDACTQCRLCENSCPYGALDHPSGQAGAGSQGAGGRRRRAFVVAALIPVAVLFFGWLGGKAGFMALPLHPDGNRAALVRLEENGGLTAPLPDAVTAFRHSGADKAALYASVQALESRHLLLGRWIGGVLGLLLALKIGSILFPERSADYRTDRGRCVSCARCYSACPYELVRRGIPVTLPEEIGKDV